MNFWLFVNFKYSLVSILLLPTVALKLPPPDLPPSRFGLLIVTTSPLAYYLPPYSMSIAVTVPAPPTVIAALALVPIPVEVSRTQV